MNKLRFLGVGHGSTEELYNTCFTIENEQGIFLIDTGGSITIVNRLKQIGLSVADVKNIFVSHSHMDHILGLIWMFKKVSILAIKGKIEEKINIYCNEVVYEAIKGITSYVLPNVLIDAVYSVTNFVILKDGDKHTINGVEYEFFDIMAKGTKQFGFECLLNNKRFVFLGDETFNPALSEKLKKADYVTHEAFCLDKEENIFHAYEKNHSTALSVAKNMNELNVKNIILYHTEESHGKDRKKLYTQEAEQEFKGKVFVPDEFEEIIL